MTGQILDADIVMTDGWIRHFWKQFNEVLPEVAVEGFSAETLSWLDSHPLWDPRIRLAPPPSATRSSPCALRGDRPYGGFAMANADPKLLGATNTTAWSAATARPTASASPRSARPWTSPSCGCTSTWRTTTNDRRGRPAQAGRPRQARRGPQAGRRQEARRQEARQEAQPDRRHARGVHRPPSGRLVAHEVGHTLGLRHNFKASSLYPGGDQQQGSSRASPSPAR